MATTYKYLSGITYSIDDNMEGVVPSPSKITTINGSDYDLFDAHRIDWNMSKLCYISELDSSRLAGFFSNNTAYEKYRYVNDPEYYDSTTDTYSYAHLPKWYTKGTHPGQINTTSELLDVIDALCYISNLNSKTIDKLVNISNKERVKLLFDENEISKYGGTIDSTTSNVLAYPIEFTLRPNQDNNNFIGSEKFYKSLESRSVSLTLQVFSESGAPVTTREVFYKGTSSSLTKKIDSNYATPFITFGDDAVYENMSLTNASTGVFVTEFNIDGWEPTIYGNKFNMLNSDWLSEDYRTDTIAFNMDFDDSDIEYRSPIADRNLSVKVHKDRNTFDNIYIDDIRYIYLGENFFDDLDDIDSEYKSKIGQNTQFIIEASKISNLNNITPEYFVDNDLLKYLININPFNTSNKIRGLNLTSGVGTKIEVYPKFYGNSFGKTELRNWLSSEDIRYSVPGSHDLNNDKYDGTDTSLANVLGNSKLLVPRLKFVNSSYNQNHENYSDINEISNLCTYTEYTNSKSVCNCEVINSKNTYVYCDPFVKRTIDGTYSYGFMCYTMITATGDTDDYDDYNSNEENSYQRGCIDLYLGTNATYYVGANVMRLRLFVTKSAEVYFIDRTKKYDTTETEIVPLRNQCENDSNDLLKSYYTGQWTRDIKSSNITRNGTNNYTWKLTLPIFSGLSFNDNITKDNYTTYYITYINPQTLNVGKSLEDPKGSTSITSITSFKNSNVINKSTEYSYGFPELVISAKGSWYLYANTMLLQPVCLKSNRGVVSQEDISDEFIIDYASTYNTASSFISNLSREMKESINKGTTDEEKGKILCSYYVGINEVQTENKSDTKLSLLFLRSTTPESLVGKDTDVDDTKYSLPLILKIPESKSTVITSNTNHDEATLRVDLTITRADKDLSGWSRLVNDNQTTAERTITFNTIYPKYDITSTGFITHKNQLTKSSSYIIASRNNIGSKIINTTIDKDSETINLSKYEAELKSAKLSDLSTYTIHNFQVVNSTSGETDEYWIMQNDNYFGIGTTKCFGYENKLGTFLSWDYEPLYKTDTINSISLKLKQYGDKWFKGYYGTNDEDIREISDITIYRKQNKLITFTSDTPSKLYGKNGGETPVLAQNSSGSEKITTTSTSQWGTTNSNSNYTGLSRTFNITLKIDDFIDKGLTLSDMFTISDVELNKNVYKYGKDWNKYIKISLTSSNVTSSTKFNNIYNGSISDDNTMLNYFNSDGSVNFDNGLGYFYDGTANTIKSIEIFDIDEENLYIKPSNASVLKDSKTIKLIVIIALPLTPEYRGLLLYAKINLIGE